MKGELTEAPTGSFELHAQHTENGTEYWSARDLQGLLDYDQWRNFIQVISKAKVACQVSGHEASDHFADVSKMVDIGPGNKREIDDVMLTRYACYLIVQNGDPRKEQVAFAQTYFAMKTRQAELIERRIVEQDRVSAHKKLTQTEGELSEVICKQTGKDCNFDVIRDKGDQSLFAKSTQQMKARWKVPSSRPIADFAPTIILKAKDFAAAITVHNAHEKNMSAESQISKEHVTNNQAIRKTLIERGIRPESLTPAEDIKKTERRIVSQKKKMLSSPDV